MPCRCICVTLHSVLHTIIQHTNRNDGAGRGWFQGIQEAHGPPQLTQPTQPAQPAQPYPTSPTGPTGPTGPIDPTGATGPNGAQLPTGPNRAQPGPAGPTGPDWPNRPKHSGLYCGETQFSSFPVHTIAFPWASQWCSGRGKGHMDVGKGRELASGGWVVGWVGWPKMCSGDQTGRLQFGGSGDHWAVWLWFGLLQCFTSALLVLYSVLYSVLYPMLYFRAMWVCRRPVFKKRLVFGFYFLTSRVQPPIARR